MDRQVRVDEEVAPKSSTRLTPLPKSAAATRALERRRLLARDERHARSGTRPAPGPRLGVRALAASGSPSPCGGNPRRRCCSTGTATAAAALRPGAGTALRPAELRRQTSARAAAARRVPARPAARPLRELGLDELEAAARAARSCASTLSGRQRDGPEELVRQPRDEHLLARPGALDLAREQRRRRAAVQRVRVPRAARVRRRARTRPSAELEDRRRSPQLLADHELQPRPRLVDRADLRVDEPDRQRDVAHDVLGDVGRHARARASATRPTASRRARSPRCSAGAAARARARVGRRRGRRGRVGLAARAEHASRRRAARRAARRSARARRPRARASRA